MAKLPSEFIDEITKSVIKIIEKENNKAKKEKKDWRLRNTRLLLKNYRMLEEHCKSVETDLEAYEEIVYEPEELELHALMKYKAKTAKMLLYFDDMFKAYYGYCYRAGEATQRRYQVLDRLYVSDNEMSADDIAEYFNINARTVYKDVDKAIEELSVFLFGIDSIHDLQSGGHKLGNTRALSK
ncbi:HTH domain-containing protein [Virgibacillus sp. C22-A2]|uniref:HTH domain-containing protein n=1 Tax=Virgibacillus tibetensis TaxID=3042313 RepID=A0ABU6KAM0_9BACI|nr:HTH domain-containing protein [Virgibacillus sp. C22-A2]